MVEKIKIKMKNLCAQFMEVGQVVDFQVEKDVVGKCKIINIDKENNEIELELDNDSSASMNQLVDSMDKVSTFSIE